MAKNNHTILIHFVLCVRKLSLRFQREKVAKTQLKKTSMDVTQEKFQKMDINRIALLSQVFGFSLHNFKNFERKIKKCTGFFRLGSLPPPPSSSLV